MGAILQAVALLVWMTGAQHDYTGFRVVEVAPGIYSYVGPECTPAGLVTGNVTAIIGEEAVLVVDSGHFPSSARKMIAHLKSVTSKPVKFLVNTHWHQDHVMGNIAFQREWPEVEILAHPFTAKELAKPENGPEYAKNLQQQLPGAIEQVRGILQSGKLPSGNALTETQRENLKEMAVAFAVSAGEAPEMEFVSATRMIERDTEISLGRQKVQIRYIGEGNTEGDLVVYVPEAKVLLTGDMVVYPTPFALSSRLGVWAKTMDALLELDAAIIVPGHGPPMADKVYLQDIRRLLASVEEQTRALVAKGTPKDEAADKIDVSWFREKYVTNKMREGSFTRWFLRPVVENAYKPAAK